MNKIIISGICILVCFIMFISGCKKSSFTEKDIIGDWEAIKGDYEAITFSKEDNLQRFYTYLNGSLFTDGTWAIMSNKDIILKLTTGENEVWKNVRIENKVLSIDGGKQKYQRLETVQEKIDELISLLGSIEEINFSKAVDTEFTGNFEEAELKKIKGKMIKAIITLKTEDYTDLSNAEKKIVELLTSRGFTPSKYMNEMESLYENGPMKVLIIQKSPLNYDPETDASISIKGKTAYLEIICGVVE